MPQLLKCSKCGGQVAGDAEKCPHCGTPCFSRASTFIHIASAMVFLTLFVLTLFIVRGCVSLFSGD